MNLYTTADRVGIISGGGIVTHNEYLALEQVGHTRILSRDQLEPLIDRGIPDPWCWDHAAEHLLSSTVKLAHFYAGTFGECVRKLKAQGARVTYTSAAHDIEISQREHQVMGVPYPPHLADPEQRQKYLQPYLDADVVIVPSRHSAEVMKSYGCESIQIIPHGVNLPDPSELTSPPETFTVGYLGACGPDKGIRFLLEAWKKLNYKDALLILAGQHSDSEFVSRMIKTFGGGNIYCMGWVENITDFYNRISVATQPSASEGFGIPVLDALAHDRPVICSRGAGAADVVDPTWTYDAMDINTLCELIEATRNQPHFAGGYRHQALPYDWRLIREQYVKLWRSLQ